MLKKRKKETPLVTQVSLRMQPRRKTSAQALPHELPHKVRCHTHSETQAKPSCLGKHAADFKFQKLSHGQIGLIQSSLEEK